MRKKILAVAGCSFSALSNDNDYQGTHWSEILSTALDFDLVSLGRQGCSNGGIRLQIEEILDTKPDFAVITPTFWDRMEIPVTTCIGVPWIEQQSLKQRSSLDHDEKDCYDSSLKLKNINYDSNEYRLIAETIFSLSDFTVHPYRKFELSKEASAAVKYYIKNLYDHSWKRQNDQWIIRDGIIALQQANIPFLIFCDFLWPIRDLKSGLTLSEFWRDSFYKCIPDKCIWLDPSSSIQKVCSNNPPEGPDPGYHSSVYGQQIIAENIHNHIRTKWKL
jgi:hypothetical protein